MIYDRDTLMQELVRDEGVRLKPYRCTAGKLTIGVGRNIDDRGITNAEAMYLLNNDVAICESELTAVLPNWRELSDTRQRVMLNMVFNLGRDRLSKFTKFIGCMKLGDFEGAAKEMMDSAWAAQVGQRAVRLRDMMLRG
jgi:lysozyme